MPRKPKMTDEERRAYSAKMCGELEAVMDRAYGAMVASEEFWAAVMRTAANLTHTDRDDRSPANCMAIAAQHPNATHVLSAGDWRKVGRFPVKGSTSLRIWTPIKRRSEEGQEATAAAADGGQREAASGATEGETRKVSGFKAGPVFDISQTDGDADAPPTPARSPSKTSGPSSPGPTTYPGLTGSATMPSGSTSTARRFSASANLMHPCTGSAKRRLRLPPISPRSSSESLRAPPSCPRLQASSPTTRSPRFTSPPYGSSRSAAPSPAQSGPPPSVAANLLGSVNPNPETWFN